MAVGVGYDPGIFASGQTPLLQREQQRMQQAMQFLDQLVAGQVPTGLTGRRSERNRILTILGDIMSEFGPQAVSPQALSTWVEPALRGDLDSRNQALQFLAQQATLTGQVDPRLQAFLTGQGGSTMTDRVTRGSLLASLAGQFGGDDWFRQAYQQHLQSAVGPGGNLMGTPVANWGAVAAPFFAMQEVLGGPEAYAAAGLPGVQIPTGGQHMPVNVQDYLTSLQRTAAALAGAPAIGPEGPARQTLRERVQELLRSADEYVRNWMQSPVVSALTGAPAPTPAATPAAAALANLPQASVPQTGDPTSQAPAATGAPTAQDAVQALQNTLAQMGASAQWTLANLLANREQIIQSLGPQAYDALVIWAQTLPNNPSWTPPWNVDPIQTTIRLLRQSR